MPTSRAGSYRGGLAPGLTGVFVVREVDRDRVYRGRPLTSAPPLSPVHVHRERISTLLEAPEPVRVVAVEAAGGWGKSWALAGWAHHRKQAVGWVTLLPGDEWADAARRTATALEGLGAPAGSARAGLEAVSPEARAVGAALARSADLLAPRTALVLDELHEADPDPGLAAWLDAFTRGWPGGRLLVLSGRTLPELRWARLEVAGALRRIGPAELAADQAEARALLEGAGLEPDAETLEQILARSGGWPVALRVLAREGSGALVSEPASSGLLADFVRQEVVPALGDATAARLARLSVADELDGPTRTLLDPEGDPTRFLEALESRGWFVTRGPDLDTFRLHPLLREVLAEDLHTHEEGDWRSLHLKLAHHHAAQSRIESAVEHALTARRPRLALRWMEADAGPLLARGRSRWLARTLEAIPGNALRDAPVATRLRAWFAYHRGNGGGVDLPPLPDDAGADLRCLDHLVRAVGALSRGDVAATAAAARRAREALPAGDPFLALQTLSLLQVGFRFTGDPELAEDALALAHQVGARVDRPAEAAVGRSMAGVLLMMLGRSHASREALESALQVASSHDGAAPVGEAMAHQFLGYLQYEWNALEESEASLTRAVELAEPLEHRGVLTGAYRVLATVLLRLNRPDEARARLDDLGRLMATTPLSDRNREWLDGVRAGFALAAGDLDAVATWLRRRRYEPRSLAESPPSELHARLQEIATVVEALLALERDDEALALARAARGAALEGRRSAFAVHFGVLEAGALEALGHRDAAVEALERALNQARPEGWVRVFADQAAHIAPVLEGVRPAPDGLAHLNRVARAVEAESARSLHGQPQLTAREADVLHLLARGMSNKAMARELGVSLSTVKTHLQRLYRKLDAGSRIQALARAEAVGLL